MSPTHHEHRHACDCSAHRAKFQGPATATGWWSAMLPVLACAVCPVCLTTYAKLFSVLGIGFGLSELHHLALLVVAIGASVVLSAYRSYRSRRVWPIGVALTGSLLVLLGHLGGELHVLEWAGVLVLLGGGLREHFRLRRAASTRLAAA